METKNNGSIHLTALVTGLIIIALTVAMLFRIDRLKNRAWQVANAVEVNPENPIASNDLVRFSGIPSDGTIPDETANQKLLYFTKTEYVFQRVKDDFASRNNSESIVYKNDWVYQSSKTEKAKSIRIGKMLIVLDDITLIGKSDWSKEIIQKSGRDPKIGDKKFIVTGISAEKAVFVTGYLSKNIIDSGDIFLLSAFSENKTIEEIRESRWFSKSILFILLFTGFIIIIKPIRQMLYRSDVSSLKAVSSVNLFGWLFIFFIISILTIKVSVIFIEGIVLMYLVLFALAIFGIVKVNKRHVANKESNSQ